MTDDLEKLAAIVRRVSKSDATPSPEESLFDAGYLDSFSLTDLVAEIERDFNIRIPDSDLNPRRFDSLDRIAEYIRSRAV